jgi:DNA-binding LacI/PurR family transcriptional regulator
MTATIGVISIGQDATFFTGRYFREILTVASQEVLGHDRHIRIVALSHAQGRTHASAEAALVEQGIDAALLVAPSDIPFNYVGSDNYGAMRAIVAHLAGLGRRRIRLIQPYGDLTGDYWERARGYADAIDALELERLVGDIPHPMSEAWIGAHVLAGAPDALIAPSDDLALVGFDDEDFAAETFPSLTTVSQPLAEMARHAVAYLLDRLAGVDRGLVQEVLPNRLIVRESCGARRGERTT